MIDNYAKKRAIITGGAGFIGSNLTPRLLDLGFSKVYLIDNLMRTNSLRNVKFDSRVEFVYGDATLFEFQKLDNITHFFHLASPKINRCAENNLEGHKTIVDSGFNAVDYCVKNKVKLFFASTASVYNNIKVLPIGENNTCRPHTIYGAGKYYTECLIKSFDKMYGLDYTINRFFNVYGVNMDCSGVYTEVIFNWLNSIKNGENVITVHGDPDNKILDLVYVSDVVEAIIASTFNSNKNVFNVSTQSGVTLSQLIETIENVTNSSLVKNIVPETRKDLELKRVGDTTKLTQLGWKCKVDLEAGITKTWNWLNA